MNDPRPDPRPDPLPPRETCAHRLKVMTSTPGVRLTERGPDTLTAEAEDAESLVRWSIRLGRAVALLRYTILTSIPEDGGWTVQVRAPE